MTVGCNESMAYEKVILIYFWRLWSNLFYLYLFWWYFDWFSNLEKDEAI